MKHVDEINAVLSTVGKRLSQLQIDTTIADLRPHVETAWIVNQLEYVLSGKDDMVYPFAVSLIAGAETVPPAPLAESQA